MPTTHPADKGKTPVNLAQGVMPLTSKSGTAQTALAAGTKWKVVKDLPREALVSNVSRATTPGRVARDVTSSSVANANRGASSTIVYDAKERRFVNGNAPVSSTVKSTEASTSRETSTSSAARVASTLPNATPQESARVGAPPSQGRAASASARVGAPPPAQRSSVFAGGDSRAGGSKSRGGTMQIGPAPRATSPAATPAPRSTGRPH